MTTENQIAITAIALPIVGSAGVLLYKLVKRTQRFLGRVETGLRDVTSLRSDVSRLAAITRAEAERSPSPRAEFGPDSALEFANEPFLKIIRLSQVEANGLGWLYALPPATRDSVREQILAAARDNRVVRIHIVVQTSQSDGQSAVLSMFPLCTGLSNNQTGFWAYLDVLHPA